MSTTPQQLRIVAIVCWLCAALTISCGTFRRFGTASNNLDSGIVHAGGYYKDGDTEAGSDVSLPGGAAIAPDGGLPKLGSATQVAPADLVPADFLPPTVAAPMWCGGDPKLAGPCCVAECQVGNVIGGGAGKTVCQPLANALPAWCPPGFVAASGTVPVCAADQGDCGSDKWGGVAETGATSWSTQATHLARRRDRDLDRCPCGRQQLWLVGAERRQNHAGRGRCASQRTERVDGHGDGRRARHVAARGPDSA